MSSPPDDQLKKLGASMREINPSTLQQDPEDGDVRWFLGDAGTELFVWTHPGKPPHHVQLVFSHVSVEWSDKRGLVTGTFASASSTSGGRYDAYLMHVGGSADTEVCRAALKLLGSAQLDAGLRASLEAPLREALRPVGMLPRPPGPPPGQDAITDPENPIPDLAATAPAVPAFGSSHSALEEALEEAAGERPARRSEDNGSGPPKDGATPPKR